MRVPVVGGERRRPERGLVLRGKKTGCTDGLPAWRRVRIAGLEVRRRHSGKDCLGVEVGVETIAVVPMGELGGIGTQHVNVYGMRVEGMAVGVEVGVEVEVGVTEDMEGL